MPDYFTEGFFVEETAWHKLGTVVSTPPATREEAIVLAGHDYNVVAAPVFARFGTPEHTLRLFAEEHLAWCCCPVPTGESLAHTRAAVGHLLGLLRRRGEIPLVEAAPRAPAAAVLERFESYLRGFGGRPRGHAGST